MPLTGKSTLEKMTKVRFNIDVQGPLLEIFEAFLISFFLLPRVL